MNANEPWPWRGCRQVLGPQPPPPWASVGATALRGDSAAISSLGVGLDPYPKSSGEKPREGEPPKAASSLAEKVHSCDQERQSALEEARQNPREGIVIPECAPGGLYKPVQCHQSTGYCWCVLVDTGRPLPGTSTR